MRSVQTLTGWGDQYSICGSNPLVSWVFPVLCWEFYFSWKCPAGPEIKSCYLLRDLTDNKPGRAPVIISSRNVFNLNTDNVLAETRLQSSLALQEMDPICWQASLLLMTQLYVKHNFYFQDQQLSWLIGLMTVNINILIRVCVVCLSNLLYVLSGLPLCVMRSSSNWVGGCV